MVARALPTAGLVPVGVFVLGHYELHLVVAAGLPQGSDRLRRALFSALTVLGWSSDMFGSKVKAIGFTALLEGIMMTADAGWLSAIALCYLVAINAVANGCRLALRDATATVEWPANLVRGIAAAAVAAAGEASQLRTRAKAGRQRRVRQRTTKPRLGTIAGYGAN
jgi:hypothetical protein